MQTFKDGISGYAILTFPDPNDSNLSHIFQVFSHTQKDLAEKTWLKCVKHEPCRLVALLEVEESHWK